MDAVAEFSMLSGGCSDALLPYSRFLIHAVAFRYRDEAYLIAAAPGVGKSTQRSVIASFLAILVFGYMITRVCYR